MLKATKIWWNNFPGGHFSGEQFSWGANFRGVIFSGAFFRGAFFPGAFFRTPFPRYYKSFLLSTVSFNTSMMKSIKDIIKLIFVTSLINLCAADHFLILVKRLTINLIYTTVSFYTSCKRKRPFAWNGLLTLCPHDICSTSNFTGFYIMEQKQPPRNVLRKRCSENMQQI